MNRRTRTSTGALLLMLSPLLFASAQSSTVVHVFETVDSYEMETLSRAKITGILQGESTPKTIQLSIEFTNTDHQQRMRLCERFALMALSKPGQYYFEVKNPGLSNLGCKLTRR